MFKWMFNPSCLITIIRQRHNIGLSRDARKPVIGVSDQVQYKSACTVTEAGYSLEILAISSTRVAKTRALISCAVTVQLIWLLFSHMHKFRFI